MSAPAAAAAAPAPAKPAAAAPAPADAKAAAPAAAAAPAEKSARVFVGNLAFKTTSDALKAHMAQASPAIVSAEIISYASGRSKGCGLVEYKSVADAEKAVKNLTNTELEGRKIFVREDREPKGFGKKDPNAPKPAPKPAGENKSGPKPAAGGAGPVDSGRGRGVGRGRGRGGRGRGRGGRGGGVATDAPPRAQNTDPCNLYVGNLAWSVDDKELSDLFADFGEVKKCVVAVDRSGRSKGFATVHMAKPGDAQAAIAGLNDTQHKERKLVVRIDHYAA